MKRLVKSTLSMAMWLLASTLIFGSAAVFTSCGENTLEEILGAIDNPSGSTTVAVTDIMLDETSLEKKLGDVAVTLTATVKPDDATDKTVNWTSSDLNVATVANGEVSVIGEGTAIITATANDGSGVKATCTVTVSIPGALAGKFSVSATKQVRFSQGNLQAKIAGYISTDPDHYTYAASSWNFAEHQWDYIGNAAGNNSFAAGSTVDLFGWVGTSATYNSFGLCTQKEDGSDYSDGSDFAKCYGNVAIEALKNDWGTVAITNGGNTPNIFGWRTLTKDEWEYLINNHTKGWATVNSVNGYVIRPDGVTTAVAASYDATAWATEEAGGSLFLPAAGSRNGKTVNVSGTGGDYWTSSLYNIYNSYHCVFSSSDLKVNYSKRFYGYSVRLVYDVK